jgi:peroxiredoxin Q/BCP
MAKSRKKKMRKRKSKRKLTKIRKVLRKKAKKILKAKTRQAKARVAKIRVRKMAPKAIKKRKAAPKPITKAPAPAETSAPSAGLNVGDSVPDIKVEDDAGRQVSLSDFRGKKVVLYFYPKDDTPGCTVEACSFRDGLSQIEGKGAVVLGVSVDPVDSHQVFKQKFNLNFPLLSDANKEMVQNYGVWKKKSMYGRTYMGIERTTFLIDEEGRIAKIFPKVDVNVHFNEVLASL